MQVVLLVEPASPTIINHANIIPMAKSKKISFPLSVVLLCVVLFTAACSMRITYNRLDWIIPLYLDRYVSLSDEQEKVFDPAISRLLSWHRAEQLPRYKHLILSLRDAQRQAMSREQVLTIFAAAEGLWTELLQRGLPPVLELAATLDDAQIQQIDRALTKKITKLQKKYGSKNQTARRAVSANKMIDALEDLLGKLTKSQTEQIRQWSRTKKDTTDAWLGFRDTWRQGLIALLQDSPGRDYRHEWRLFLLQPDRLYSASHRQAISDNRQLLAQLIADLSVTVTPAQRAHLQRKLDDIIGDLDALQGQG